MDKSLEKLKAILKQKIGLDARSIGDATVNKILNQRMRQCNSSDLDSYYNYLQNNSAEMALLLEAAVIPETWFFRDTRPFDIILNGIREKLPARPNYKANILSIPCSTGEEPYSISMHLLDAGIADKNFSIHAVDISHQSLDIARQGIYGQNSFRGKLAAEYIDRYFRFIDDEYQLSEKVKERVSFSRVNILDSDDLPFNQHFDFILCRNLLIYFDLDTKHKAFQNLHKILKQDGLLFIGHSEFGSVPRTLFNSSNSDRAFALFKAEHSPKTPANNIESNRIQSAWKNTLNDHPPVQTRPDAIALSRKKPFSKAGINKTKTVVKETSPPSDILKKAREHANSGDFDNAEQLCRQHIEQHGDSCDSFFLLGLISEASNKPDLAESLFRKAIYLDPKHYESLVHLSLVLENNGDSNGARLFKQRAERCKPT